MADNITLSTNIGSGSVIATDDDATAHHQYVKIEFGGDGTQTKVTSSVGLPVGDAGGSLTVDAPAGTPVFVRLSDGTAALATLPVSIASSVAVTGTFFQATQPVSIAASVAVTGTFFQGTQPVSIATLPALVAGSAVIGHVIVDSGTITVAAHAVTNVGVFVVQIDGTALTRLTDIETNTDSGAIVGNGAAATAQRVSIANDSTGILAGVTTVATVTTVSAVTAITNALPAGDNNIGNVDIVTVPADPFGVNADAGSATGSISAKLRFIAATGIPVTGTVTVAAHAVTNGGTFVTQENGALLTAAQLLDDTVFVDDAAFTPATSKVNAVGFQADETSTDSVDEGDIGCPRMTLDRKVHVVAELASNQMRAGGVACTPVFLVIDHASSGDNTLVAADATKKIRVLQCALVAGGTVNVRFESAAGGTAKTGQIQLTAQNGFVLPFSPIGWFETAANELLNLELSGAVSVDGVLAYILV